MKRFLATLAIAMFGFSFNAQAQDFSTALAKTTSQIPDGADVASMGNANTALTSDYSTRNPGAVDASDATRGNGGFAATYANLNFARGGSVNLYILSGAVRLPVGTLQMSFTNGGSNKVKFDDFGDTLKFNNFPNLEVQYGLKLGSNLLLENDELFGGVGYIYSENDLTMQLIDGTSLKSIGSSHSAEAGVLYRIAGKVNLGAMFMHSWDRAEDSAEGFSEVSHSQSDELRVGVSAKVTSLTMISADYRHLYLRENQHDDQWFAGIEQYLVKDTVAVYGGYANGGATTGIGVYAKNFGINLAYMHRPFRSTEEFFGKAQVFMASIYGSF